MTDTVLGVTILKDVVVIICFTLVVAVAGPALSETADLASTGAGAILVEQFLSLVAGAAIGGLMILYLSHFDREHVLFLLGTALAITLVSDAFHLSNLLVAIVAGLVVSNLSSKGEQFVAGLERASPPVFLVFFAMAGADLNLDALRRLWVVAALLVVSRAAFTFLGTWLGATLARDNRSIRHSSWVGFLGQAGVSLGFATLLKRGLPDLGALLCDMVVATVVVNQVIGPVLFKWALERAGETRTDQGAPLETMSSPIDTDPNGAPAG